MCEVSQDLGGICAVALVRRADRDNLQSFMHLCVELIETICSLLCPLGFAVAVLSCNCGWAFAQHKLGSWAWCGWSIGDCISIFSLRISNIGEVPYEVSVHQFWKKTWSWWPSNLGSRLMHGYWSSRRSCQGKLEQVQPWPQACQDFDDPAVLWARFLYTGTVIATFPRVDSLVIHIGATWIKITLVQIFITGMSQETKTAC